MTSTVFQNYEAALGHTPLQYPNGQAWLKAHGSIKDFLADRLRLAIKERFPGLATPDALVALGIERQIPRGPNESDALYAARIQAAWNTWPNAGTGVGLVSALYTAGYTNALVAQQNLLWFQNPTGSSPVITQRPAGEWNIDNNTANWGRFVVILPPPIPATAFTGMSRNVVSSTITFSPSPSTSNPVQYPVRFRWTITTVGAGAGTSTYTIQQIYNGAVTATLTGITPGSSVITYDTAFSGVSGYVNTGLLLRVGNTGSGMTVGGYFDDIYRYTVQPDLSDEAKRVANLIRLWKPGHATCAQIEVLADGDQVTLDYYPAGRTLDTDPRPMLDDIPSDDTQHTFWSP